uniref:hypothetical protein n=2 Tax=Bacillus cereus TaxID=1396 RepID=UPI001445C45B|nr:hypothetical protein [Bacillus cereus]
MWPQNYVLSCLYNGKENEETHSFFDVEGDFHNRRRTCGENRYRLIQTHGMEMLSVRERNMRVWKLKKKLDDKENELTNIKRKVKEGMDTERKKLDNRRTGF